MRSRPEWVKLSESEEEKAGLLKYEIVPGTFDRTWKIVWQHLCCYTKIVVLQFTSASLPHCVWASVVSL